MDNAMMTNAKLDVCCVSEFPLRPTAFPDRSQVALGCRGFTLVELIVVSAILGVLMLIALPTYTAYMKSVKESRCMADIRTLEKDISAYAIEKNALPDTNTFLTEIGRDGLLDPWGRNYVYLKIAGGGGVPYKDLLNKPFNTDFDLYSRGEDGNSTATLAGDPPPPENMDDIIRTEGGYVGLGKNL
jgi:general secretion pathway protein G